MGEARSGATPRSVTLVIPARNAAATLRPCLEAVVPLLGRGALCEIVLVDDGSSDATAEIARNFPVRYLRGEGRGPGHARNLGWRAAQTPLVWFVDSDCVAEPDALDLLREALIEADVAAAGGSYGNMRPGSLLATLIHEEIVERHRSMGRDVDFLATFNVLYRRAVLEQVGGFDERFLKAQDAELAFRVRRAGFRLQFEPRSRVHHFHEDRLARYLQVQRRQGYWRAWLYLEHADRAAGDSYSGLADHMQPLLALAVLGLLPLAAVDAVRAGWLAALGGLLVAQLPMTVRLLRRTGRLALWSHAPLGFARAFARGIGLAHGTLAALLARRQRPGDLAQRSS
jgi:GT2 family glycosyltransferase